MPWAWHHPIAPHGESIKTVSLYVHTSHCLCKIIFAQQNVWVGLIHVDPMCIDSTDIYCCASYIMQLTHPFVYGIDF
jgi:hypothetical protein